MPLRPKAFTDTIRHEYFKETTITCIQRPTGYIPDLVDLIKEKRKTRKRWQTFRRPIDKQYLTYMTRYIHSMISDHKTRQLDKDIRTAVAKNNIWTITKRTRKRTNYPIHGQNGLVFDNQEKAQAIAETLDRSFRSRTNDQTFENFHRRTRRDVKRYLATPPTHDIPLTSPTEVKEILKRIDDEKAPGPDKVTVKALKELPRKATVHMTKLFNASLILRHFPAPFKMANIIALPKPNKNPMFPQNHRPISLLNHAGKVLERIILDRITPHVNDIIPDTQFGFKKRHSTTQQLLRMTDDITTGFLNREHTTAVFFDIEKAYDSVWHMGLIQKLMTFNIPDSYIHLIHSHITQRP